MPFLTFVQKDGSVADDTLGVVCLLVTDTCHMNEQITQRDIESNAPSHILVHS
jgi:hypothetical protein